MQLYSRNSDQWRMGPSGPYALDMNVIYAELNDMGLVGDDRQVMLAKIRLIVKAARNEMK